MIINTLSISNIGYKKVSANDNSSIRSNLSFKGGDVSDSFMREVNNAHDSSGHRNFKILVHEQNRSKQINASKSLVREGHFLRISAYLERLEGDEVKLRDKLIITDLSSCMSQLGQTNPKVSKFVRGVLESPKVTVAVKQIIQSTFK